MVTGLARPIDPCTYASMNVEVDLCAQAVGDGIDVRVSPEPPPMARIGAWCRCLDESFDIRINVGWNASMSYNRSVYLSVRWSGVFLSVQSSSIPRIDPHTHMTAPYVCLVQLYGPTYLLLHTSLHRTRYLHRRPPLPTFLCLCR